MGDTGLHVWWERGSDFGMLKEKKKEREGGGWKEECKRDAKPGMWNKNGDKLRESGAWRRYGGITEEGYNGSWRRSQGAAGKPRATHTGNGVQNQRL